MLQTEYAWEPLKWISEDITTLPFGMLNKKKKLVFSTESKEQQ